MVASLLIGAVVGSAVPPSDPCKGFSTIEMAQCMDGKIAKATKRLRAYVGRAKARYEDEDRSTMTAIADADVAFEAYKETYCGAVEEQWRTGSIHFAMSQSCQLKLIDEQTHRVWQDFLTYFDSTPPLLPEPKPTK